jgi:hypothetical protein
MKSVSTLLAFALAFYPSTRPRVEVSSMSDRVSAPVQRMLLRCHGQISPLRVMPKRQATREIWPC